MIKINLITVKRRKPIQIPFAFIFLVIALIGILAGFIVATTMVDDMVGKKAKEEELKSTEEELRRNEGRLREVANLRSQAGALETQIRNLEQVSGANLLQWSEIFSRLSFVVPDKTVWLTNLRIDSDRRVQITGYSCAEPDKKDDKRLSGGLQDFVNQLQGDQYFREVFLSAANKLSFEKVPVWRFDIQCRVSHDAGGR